MATIKELHKKMGNPNLMHWRTIKLLSIREASLLIAGIDPNEYTYLNDDQLSEELASKKPTNWQYVLMMMRSLVEAICTHELKSPSVMLCHEWLNNGYPQYEEQAKLGISEIDDVLYSATKIHRDELSKWLYKNGYLEPQRQNIITIEQNYSDQMPVVNDVVLALPEPTYTTPPLEALQGVINEFWINYDPNRNQLPPKQDVVTQWIAEKYPMITGKDLRLYIDKICRHPTAKGGGNKKINQ